MLYNCGATKIPVELDTSQATDLTYFACISKFVELPVIDMRGVDSSEPITNAIYNCPDLERVEKVYLHGGTFGSNTFTRLGALTEIRFEGDFVASISFSSSTKLSRESIESIVAALSDTATGKTLTLSRTAVNTAFETSVGAADGSTSDEWTALLATKDNWTVTLR